MESPNPGDKRLRRVRIMAWLLLVLVPIEYYHVAYIIRKDSTEIATPRSEILIALFVLAVISLFMLLFWQHFILKRQIKLKSSPVLGSPIVGFFITQMAMAESVFMFGLVYFFLSHELQPMNYFYVLGMIGIILAWPTRSRFDKAVDALEAK